jgi:16S rRNA (adenine1518-N6/adenine1519-N6)-dimethyltransferase
VPPERFASFRATLALAFGHRRKTVANSIAATLGRAVALGALDVAGIDPRRRAETLALDELVALDRAISEVGDPGNRAG